MTKPRHKMGRTEPPCDPRLGIGMAINVRALEKIAAYIRTMEKAPAPAPPGDKFGPGSRPADQPGKSVAAMLRKTTVMKTK